MTKRSVDTKSGDSHLYDHKSLGDYKFDAPLLITSMEFYKPAPGKWESGSAWVSQLSHIGKHEKEYGKLLGIVIPLELKSGSFARQDLLGVELLTWLRWSAEESQRCVPVLVTAFQSLESVLRSTFNLLVVAGGTRYLRLPDDSGRLEAFVKEIGKPTASKFWANASELDRLAGTAGDSVRRMSYHDLANDHYGAYRLWEGYKAALEDAHKKIRGKDAKTSLDNEIKRIEKYEDGLNARNEKPVWVEKTEALLSQPHVKQYLALAKQGLGAPGYFAVQDAEDLILRHVEKGLPPKTRILLVDDEFDKGLADVLLQILFKKSEFTIKKKDQSEWVYMELNQGKPWARLVCVKTADLATQWLGCWGDIDETNDSQESESDRDSEGGQKFSASKRQWFNSWLNDAPFSSEHEKNNLRNILSEIERLPDTSDGGRGYYRKDTLVLLDLRLEPGEQQDTYEPLNLKSAQLRELIKQKEEPAPVIMFTASRQAMNYAMVMNEAGKTDGWLIKEGPDINPDNENSARSVHYLLRHIHRLAVRREWYRDELGWEGEWIEAYDALRSMPNWDERLKKIRDAAQMAFEKTQDQKFLSKDEIQNGLRLKWMDTFISELGKSEKILAQRLVVFVIALSAGKIENGKFEHVVANFNAKMPGARGRAGKENGVVYPSDVVTFKPLWAKYKDLPSQMLKEEYEWILTKLSEGQVSTYLQGVMKDKFPEDPELQ